MLALKLVIRLFGICNSCFQSINSRRFLCTCQNPMICTSGEKPQNAISSWPIRHTSNEIKSFQKKFYGWCVIFMGFNRRSNVLMAKKNITLMRATTFLYLCDWMKFRIIKVDFFQFRNSNVFFPGCVFMSSNKLTQSKHTLYALNVCKVQWIPSSMFYLTARITFYYW